MLTLYESICNCVYNALNLRYTQNIGEKDHANGHGFVLFIYFLIMETITSFAGKLPIFQMKKESVLYIANWNRFKLQLSPSIMLA